MTPPYRAQLYGFSLVELSIVLVILGLLIGGVMSGRALIRSAERRAAMVQVNEMMIAARTFRDKYFYFPGDVPQPMRTEANLPTDICYGCDPNGDGVIIGTYGSMVDGEAILFWLDLAQAGLIQGGFAPLPWGGNGNLDVSGDAVAGYLGRSKLGSDQYMYVWSGGINHSGLRFGNDGFNYLGIAGVTRLTGYNVGGTFTANPTTPTIDAFNIDKKMDDGMPQTGNVRAIYIGYIAGAYASWPDMVMDPAPAPGSNAVSPSATSCMDNGGVVGPMNYSVSLNNGENKTCALTFKM